MRISKLAGAAIAIWPLLVWSQDIPEEAMASLEKVRLQVESTKDQVVTTLRTHFDIADGDDVHMGAIDTLEELTGWKDNQPDRRKVSRTVTGKPGFHVTFSMGIEDKPESSLMAYEKVKRFAFESLDGMVFEVFDVADREGSWEARVWITQSEHELRRVDYRIFDPPIFGVKTLSYTITFAPDATGRPLPKFCDIQATGSILLFMTRKVKIHQEYLAWTRREGGS